MIMTSDELQIRSDKPAGRQAGDAGQFTGKKLPGDGAKG